jgi:hypothetical protein
MMSSRDGNFVLRVNLVSTRLLETCVNILACVCNRSIVLEHSSISLQKSSLSSSSKVGQSGIGRTVTCEARYPTGFYLFHVDSVVQAISCGTLKLTCRGPLTVSKRELITTANVSVVFLPIISASEL